MGTLRQKFEKQDVCYLGRSALNPWQESVLGIANDLASDEEFLWAIQLLCFLPSVQHEEDFRVVLQLVLSWEAEEIDPHVQHVSNQLS